MSRFILKDELTELITEFWLEIDENKQIHLKARAKGETKDYSVLIINNGGYLCLQEIPRLKLNALGLQTARSGDALNGHRDFVDERICLGKMT